MEKVGEEYDHHDGGIIEDVKPQWVELKKSFTLLLRKEISLLQDIFPPSKPSPRLVAYSSSSPRTSIERLLQPVSSSSSANSKSSPSWAAHHSLC
jgi:hypothetical protein